MGTTETSGVKQSSTPDYFSLLSDRPDRYRVSPPVTAPRVIWSTPVRTLGNTVTKWQGFQVVPINRETIPRTCWGSG